jgi:hypothetical protein
MGVPAWGDQVVKLLVRRGSGNDGLRFYVPVEKVPVLILGEQMDLTAVLCGKQLTNAVGGREGHYDIADPVGKLDQNAPWFNHILAAAKRPVAVLSSVRC